MTDSRKVLIFDFGNVLIRLNFERSFVAFENILNVDWSDRIVPPSIQEAIAAFDKGALTPNEFINRFRSFNPDASDIQIIDAWNSLLENIPSQRLTFLENLKSQYKLVLLSNINDIHLHKIHDHLENDHGIIDFEKRFFDHAFYSYHIGMRKPDNNIYLHVLKELQCTPQEILFIDDLPKNIETARNHNWNGVVHNPEKDIENELSAYIEQSKFG